VHNAIRVGINPKWIHVLFSYENEISPGLLDLSRKYHFVNFHFYERSRINNFGYIPVLRPDALEQHFTKYPELRGEVIFYHDSDIVFKELPDFDSMYDDAFWYLSDTVSYIGAKYIQSKGKSLLDDLCQIAKIDQKLVGDNHHNSGGAQYLMKGVTADYWKEVKGLCVELYKYMAKREMDERKSLSQEESISYNPIQKWCADMWAVLWCAWKRGHQTRISEELGFSWGSGGAHEWVDNKIMHNAGVVDDEKGSKFFKGDYISKSPFDEDLSFVDPQYNSWNYVQAILYAAEQRKDL
jgi:hypothetical protein